MILDVSENATALCFITCSLNHTLDSQLCVISVMMTELL